MSSSSKRPLTARMHASPRKKPRTDSGLLTTALDPTPAGAWVVKANIGDCAPFTDHAGWVDDPSSNMVYMFGGTYPGDQNEVPTSEFYQLDTKAMEWQNLTDTLRYRDPYDPFGPAELRREERPLPRLGQPGLTLVRFHGTSFIFIFGGFSVEGNEPVSTLIAVDVEHREWWYVPVDGGPVSGRIKPVVVAVDQRIYIFGGCKKYSEANPQSLQSYCIASYQPVHRKWTWEARDVPYPSLIPPDQVFDGGVAIYNGKKIMLTPGKPLCHNEPLNFTEQKIFYFHTEHRQFQMAPHLGDYPNEVLWYSIHRFPSSPSRPQPKPLPSFKPRGRPPKREPTENQVLSCPIPSTSHSSPPCVIMCAWVPRPNSQYAVPELWRLSLTHNDEIRCLNKSQIIWDLNHDFQGCVVANDRIVLLGNNNPSGKESWNIHLSVMLTPEDRQERSRLED